MRKAELASLTSVESADYAACELERRQILTWATPDWVTDLDLGTVSYRCGYVYDMYTTRLAHNHYLDA